MILKKICFIMSFFDFDTHKNSCHRKRKRRDFLHQFVIILYNAEVFGRHIIPHIFRQEEYVYRSHDLACVFVCEQW